MLTFANLSLLALFGGRRSAFLTATRQIIPFSRRRRFTVVEESGDFTSALISARIVDADLNRLALLIA